MGRNIGGDKSSHSNGDFGDNQQVMSVQQPTQQRIIYLAGTVDESTIVMVNAQLIALASQNDNPITLVVSTYGGSIHEMFSLYDTIKFLNCPVRTVGLGKIMSAGVLLLASGEKGNRLIGPSTRVMIHPISAFAHGNVFDLENEVQEIKYLQRFMTDFLVKETKMTKEQLVNLFKTKTDTYFSALECVKLGIVDKIMGDKKSD